MYFCLLLYIYASCNIFIATTIDATCNNLFRYMRYILNFYHNTQYCVFAIHIQYSCRQDAILCICIKACNVQKRDLQYNAICTLQHAIL